MKTILCVLILIFTVLCAGCISGNNEYSGEKVSFEYPNNWNISNNSSDTVTFDGEDVFRAEVVLYPNTKDVQSLIDEIVNTKSGSGRDICKMESKNPDALYVFNTYGPDDGTGIRAVYCDAFIQGKNDDIWYVSVNGPGAEGIEDSFEMIVDSFKTK